MDAGTSAGTVWRVTMSLDGYIAGPDDSMDWAYGHGPAGSVAEEIRDATGANLGAGVRLYGDGSAPAVTLERIGAALSPQLTDLRFRVAG